MSQKKLFVLFKPSHKYNCLLCTI